MLFYQNQERVGERERELAERSGRGEKTLVLDNFLASFCMPQKEIDALLLR